MAAPAPAPAPIPPAASKPMPAFGALPMAPPPAMPGAANITDINLRKSSKAIYFVGAAVVGAIAALLYFIR